jgi:3-mercaptopropionate dioxygenase
MNARLKRFVDEIEQAVATASDEGVVLELVTQGMRKLVAVDDWLPEEAAVAHPVYYQQHLLHRDAAARFSIVSFVWGPGQATPIHDHTTWGVIGMLRGQERSQPFRRTPLGMVADGDEELLQPGNVTAVSPTIGDIHRVRNGHDDRVSISIHAYGADIGQVRRHVFDAQTGQQKEFVSGYSKVTR